MAKFDVTDFGSQLLGSNPEFEFPDDPNPECEHAFVATSPASLGRIDMKCLRCGLGMIVSSSSSSPPDGPTLRIL